MELIFILMAFGFGYIAGWLGHAKSFLDRLLADPDSMIKLLNDYKKNSSAKEPTDDRIVKEIEVEKENGIFYLYVKDTGEFLAQAPSLDEALEQVYKRFPNQLFQGIISKEEAKQMGLSN